MRGLDPETEAGLRALLEPQGFRLLEFDWTLLRRGRRPMAVQTSDKVPVEIRLRPKPIKVKKGKK